MLIRLCRALLAAVLLCAPAPAAARAAEFPRSDCPRYGDLRICTAQVPSFDGTPLDADLTLPAGKAPSGGGHPLIVLLHGFGGDKHDWQSTDDSADGGDKWHWNSHWFAKRGYYVLSYTARGFRSDAASQPWQPETPAGSSASLPSGTIQLKSRDAEIRDTQWLAALAAATFADLDRARVVVSGGSYGGGESWLQSSQPEWTFPHSVDPSLPELALKVAVPKYGWSDLAYSLAPHGRGDPYTAAAGRAGEQPIGVVKLSYVNGFYAVGSTDGIFEAGTRTAPTAAGEGPISVPAWRARLADAGDPYDAAGAEDPVVAQARRGLTEFRGSHYQDRPGGRRVAVFSIQGWTDDLFGAVESTREFLALKALDPRWPVSLAFADVGHPRAQNKDATWEWLNAQANAFLRANLDRAREGVSTVTSEETTCDGSTGARVSAAGPRALGTRTRQLRAAGRQPPARLGQRRSRRRRHRPRRRLAGRDAARALPHLAGADLAGPLHGAHAAARGAARDRRARRGPDPVHARAAGLRGGRRTRLGRRARRHRAAGDARRGAAGPARLRRARRASCASACSATTGACPPATGCASTSPRPTSRCSAARTSPRRSASAARSSCCPRAARRKFPAHPSLLLIKHQRQQGVAP